MTKQTKPQKCYWFNISRQEGTRDAEVYRDCRVCDGKQPECAFYFQIGSKVVNQPSELEVKAEW